MRGPRYLRGPSRRNLLGESETESRPTRLNQRQEASAPAVSRLVRICRRRAQTASPTPGNLTCSVEYGIIEVGLARGTWSWHGISWPHLVVEQDTQMIRQAISMNNRVNGELTLQILSTRKCFLKSYDP